MLSVQEATARLLANVRPCPAIEEVSLLEALGRVLAADVHAGIDVPPAANSAMDGYAIRFHECTGPEQKIPLSQRIAAGHPPRPLRPGTAARIFTGAEIPLGADTVVMQENCAAGEDYVTIQKLPNPGDNIRPRGQDLSAGQKILARGQRLRAQDLGLLASQGLDRANVYKRLRVAVMSTGDELIEPGQAQQPGQIYNSNRYTMHGLLSAWGCEVLDLGVAPDRVEAISDRMVEAAQGADVIISSGGVSVGEEDHVKAVVESLGSIDLWRIAIKPGKPFAFGRVKGTPFLGLPGNPVSVFVTLLVIGRPFLLACQGIVRSEIQPSRLPARFDKPGSTREEYLRARSTPGGLELYSSQSSGVLMSTSWGDGLIRQAVNENIHSGELVDFLPYSSLY
jgi:molybdopterin molybdotransferase